MKYYDQIISLGQFCTTAHALKRLFLQELTYPFDWIDGGRRPNDTKGGLETRVDLICNDFEFFFDFEDLENLGRNLLNEKEKIIIRNKQTELIFNHDFYADISIKEQYQEVFNKYQRRIKRLYENVNKSKNVLFVYVTYRKHDKKFLTEQQRKLANKFKNTDVTLLCIMNNDSYNIYKYDLEKVNKNVYTLTLNYRFTRTNEHPERLWGNKELYYMILNRFCFSKCTLENIIKLQKYLINLKYNELTWFVNKIITIMKLQ